MLSETSAVTFFGFFNFYFFFIDLFDGKGVDKANFGHANGFILGGNDHLQRQASQLD